MKTPAERAKETPIERWKDHPTVPVVLAEDDPFLWKAQPVIEAYRLHHFLVREVADGAGVARTVKAARQPGQQFEILFFGNNNQAGRELEASLQEEFEQDPELPCVWRRIGLPTAVLGNCWRARSEWLHILTDNQVGIMIVEAIDPTPPDSAIDAP